MRCNYGAAIESIYYLIFKCMKNCARHILGGIFLLICKNQDFPIYTVFRLKCKLQLYLKTFCTAFIPTIYVFSMKNCFSIAQDRLYTACTTICHQQVWLYAGLFLLNHYCNVLVNKHFLPSKRKQNYPDTENTATQKEYASFLILILYLLNLISA